MDKELRKIKKYLELIGGTRWYGKSKIENITACPCGYKTDNTPPPLADFKPFGYYDRWGSGWDTHAWFHFTVKPDDPQKKGLYLKACTEISGWDATNPQFITYINGEMRQGLDTNHREVLLEGAEEYDIYLYAYTGPRVENARFFAETTYLDEETNALYYDIRYPLEMLEYLNRESGEYANILHALHRAVSKLDLYEIGSDEYRESVKEAREYLQREFYEKYCDERSAKVIGIGHTHIDCAWRWTLQQTREKVQRSFATVLELMKRYPEYKFMSSQALLYQNLKEEAPELYRQVAERIKEGRWECEGAMWVEADCNLSSGESLVRQVLYGKNFFRQEFGVENRILWLPDVFGYSAALPQILRKSGVDWFVTSKISWNDTNRMPYDTFRWKGIDGTEINTFFLTPQDDRGGQTANYTTYVGNTGAKMIAGTWKRYQQKNLNNEALLTFGYGDGGGGPTAEHLELARRGAKGIEGGPQVKVEFAGDFLNRLEKKLEGNREVPKWQGELYLEYHRGTYTTMARNKRWNRQSEFTYQDAELRSVIADKLCGIPFPKADLHRGWEMILTNQFHDIIPGSSIKEVYDQSDKDYAVILGISENIRTDTAEKIASSLSKEKGYAVFNPHSFTGRTTVKADGRTAWVNLTASKGYFCTTDFDFTNSVRINGRTVDTDTLRVQFDEAWQITSIYDKRNRREILTNGAVGNELQVYADYPEKYDAWEWMDYSKDDYKTITATSCAEIVDDGARKGIRITRPYMQSTITQTVWFYDGTAKIDFETTVDWHQRHQMLKTAFPVDVNTDKATYEIQFGSTERPTHFNTSWDNARFEVCAHKYADVSDGGYGVSIMNDCKYGHDIHDGVIRLSLLRSPTDPNPEADQGEIRFTYSILPHAGRLADSETVKEAYYLNLPAEAVKLTGDADLIPETFSAISTDKENIIIETVKEAENGAETVIRMYECFNKRTETEITIGIPAKRVYLADMMENKLRELPVNEGKINLTVGGFEIITLIAE